MAERLPPIASFALVVGVLTTGCDAGPAASGPVARDSAGITIVENDHTRPAWEDDGWRISAEPILQIGAVDAEGPEQLHGVTHSGLLPSGNVMVVSSRSQEVRVFDPAGRHVRTIGRRGDGPGEFRSPWQAYQLPGDSLMVVDLYRATSIFDADGAYVRQFVPGGIGGEMQGAPLGQFGDGTVLLMKYQREDPSWTGLRRSQVELVRFDREGNVATSFGMFDEQTVQYGAGPRYFFGPWAKAIPAERSIWYGPGDRFELREIGFDGRIARLVRLDLPPRPVTAADREAFTERMLDRVRGTPDEPAFRRVYGDAQFAAEFPAHLDIRVDDRGHLWVQDYQPWTARVERTWYVFDPDGRYLGPIAMPAGFTVHQIAGDRVIGRWTDDLDVEYVRIHRIENRDPGEARP